MGMFSRLTLPRLGLAGVFASGLIPAVAGAQELTVVGIVLEREEATRIASATVQLSGSSPVFTDRGGAFRFTGVVPGRHTLTLRALGYRPLSMELDVRADTALVVRMDPDPLLLDSLLVRAGNITIRGEILDATTGLPVLFAQVTVQPDMSTVGAVSGRFTVRRVPSGRPVTVLVEAVEYKPARIPLITVADTTLTIELDPDPVGIRIVAEQVKKLQARSNSVPYSRSVIDRSDLVHYRGGTAYDIVEARLRTVRYSRNPLGMTEGGTTPQCIFLDDVQQIDRAILWSIPVGQLERIEIYDRGGMIRAYTKRYLFGLLGRDPPPVFYLKYGLLGVICR